MSQWLTVPRHPSTLSNFFAEDPKFRLAETLVYCVVENVLKIQMAETLHIFCSRAPKILNSVRRPRLYMFYVVENVLKITWPRLLVYSVVEHPRS